MTNLLRKVGWLACAAVAAVYGAGCGGSSGSSTPSLSRGSIPPAPAPVCTSLARGRAVPQSAHDGGGQAGVLVPSTSIPQPGDAGVRAHTNHLILVRGASTRSSGPSGLVPNQLYKAYGVPLNSGHEAIAIVDAYNYPTALNDFNFFSTTFHLPTENSMTATSDTNSVFQVVYASGTVPLDDAGWGQEMAVDCEWAHAMAPQAKIYLVEAASSNLSDLMAAVNVAKQLNGVRQVTLSFGSVEDACSLVNYDATFLQNGVAFFASAGDTSGERDFPAESMNVVAVGGTTLTVAGDGSRISEIAWNSTGGGPSQFEPRPVFQDVIEATVQGYRANADIAAVGDPQTGVSVYDSLPYQGSSGWQVFGGTSTSTPIVAGMANASGSSRNSSQAQNAALYAALGSSAFHDITIGTSGIFSAGPGWDYLTGVGTPNGLGGF
ncbi:MAG: S53 family peptidase [Fimbriimonadaceae bacterium]